jgi:methylase of polypeptide subunit release factors
MNQTEYLLSELEVCIGRIRILEDELDACCYSSKTQQHETTTTSSSHYTTDNALPVQHILEELASAYNEVVDLRNKLPTTDPETLADAWLDVAISCKRAGRIESSIHAIRKRMDVCSHYKTTDAVRLLGLEKCGEELLFETFTLLEENYDVPSVSFYRIEELNKHGIFETATSSETSNDNDSSCPSSPTFVPTKNARELGNKVSRIFLSRGYRLRECQLFLLPFVDDVSFTKDEDGSRWFRIFSANSFFQHRHAVHEAKLEAAASNNVGNGVGYLDMGELEVLVWIFLFGLAIEKETVVRILGQDDFDLLIEARLVTLIHVSASLVVGEFQVFPIDLSVFLEDCMLTSVEMTQPQDIPNNPSSPGYLFMTDWPLESLRLPRNAIMPVGYDTLELLSLVAGVALQQNDKDCHNVEEVSVESPLPQQHQYRRILDLCCGCGIQGIFALQVFREMSARLGSATSSLQLVSSDINKRAIHFVTANSALNNIYIGPTETTEFPTTPVDSDQASLDSCAYAVCGDIYDALLSGSQSTTTDYSLSSPSTTFDWILCNPPFVAAPSPLGGVTQIEPSLYAVGGGVDGMDCLRRILRDVFRFLSSSSSAACEAQHRSMMLMVTEIPNIEEGCVLLLSMLDESERKSARIRVAYVEDDVETVEDYSFERKAEVVDAPSEMKNDWCSPMLQAGIHNRALVLISIARRPIHNNRHTMCSIIDDTECNLRLYKYSPSVQLQEGGEDDLTTTTGRAAASEFVDSIDEEDAFLTPQGMAFARSALLVPPLRATKS